MGSGVNGAQPGWSRGPSAHPPVLKSITGSSRRSRSPPLRWRRYVILAALDPAPRRVATGRHSRTQPGMNASDLFSRRTKGAPPVATRHVLLGVPADDATTQDALAFLAAAIERRRVRGQAPAHCAQVVTLNPEMLMAARRDAALREAIQTAALVVADGIGIVLAARLLGVRLRERVTGVDLLEAFTGLAAERGFRIFLLAAPPGVARVAGEALVRRHPGLVVAGSYAGSPAAEAAEMILARLAAARPDALFVAFGSPAHERWLAARRGRAVAGGSGCVGRGAGTRGG